MEIIGNVSSKHIEFMKTQSLKADELIFFSPYCYQDFADFFHEIIHDNIRSVTMITTLKPEDATYKVNSLVSFIDELSSRKIKWKLKINNKLHGKMYFFKNNGCLQSAIITSANLTENGMMKNHEWGCLIDDIEAMNLLYQEAISVIEFHELTEDHVLKLLFAVDDYNSNNPNNNNNSGHINISDIISEATGINFTPETHIFLKPYGSKDDKIYSGDFSNENKMYFSRRRPNSVRINDLLVCYAVGSTKLTSVFKVLSEPIHTGKNSDRWPWYVEVKNLTPHYGQRWFETENTISKVQHDYLKQDENNCLTFNGGKTLGAFQFGADKIRLNDDFGKYLINIIKLP